MFNFLNNNSQSSQKKLITLQHFSFIDAMVKAEARSKNSSDSFVIEDALLEHYLNSNDLLATPVAVNLFEENGVVKTVKALNTVFLKNPEYANDSYLEVLNYINKLIQINPTNLTMHDKGLNELAEAASIMLDEIVKIKKANPGYRFSDSNGKDSKFVDSFDLLDLKDVTEAAKSERKLTMENLPYLGLSSVITFWNFGNSPDLPTFKNWKGTYMLVDRILNVCILPDEPSFKYDLAALIRKMTLDDGSKGRYDSSVPALDKMICLKRKLFYTTKEAVILHSVENKRNEFFSNAFRIIHGPGVPTPAKPYIILFNSESEEELYKIVEDLLKNFPEEFPDPSDAYLVQFLYGGMYYDCRIKWGTV